MSVNPLVGKTISSIEFCHDGATLADCKLGFTDGSEAFISFQFCPSAEVVFYGDKDVESSKQILRNKRKTR